MSLEDLEKEIYGFKKAEMPRQSSKSFSQKSQLNDLESKKEEKIAESWEELEKTDQKNKKEQKGNFLKIIIVFSLILIVFGVFLIIKYLNAPAEPKIKVEIIAPSLVKAGAPFELTVNLSNQTGLVLQNSSLTLSLPSGLVPIDGNNKMIGGEFRENLGDIGIGGITKKSFTLMAIEEDGNNVRKVNAVFVYNTGSRQRFEQKAFKEIIVEGSAIETQVKMPERVLSGSVFEIEINYRNVSNYDFDSLIFEINYPQGFEFISASLAPTSLNNYWNLGGLRAGSSSVLKIRGQIKAAEQTFFSIPATLSLELNGYNFVINKTSFNLSIAPSPLDIAIVVNNNPSYVARIGDYLNYTINYKNQSGIALADVVIKAKLSGELFDFTSLQSRAQFDSLNKILTWNVSNVPELRVLQSGEGGSVNFSIRLLSNFPVKRSNDKNYILKLEVAIDSPTVPYYLNDNKTSASSFIETKVAGLITVDAQAFYRDAAAGIVNSGTMPPKVNQPTQYTIHWIVKNYATDVKDVELRAFLQSGVSLTGVVKSNVDTVPLYSERTQEVVWRINQIPANKGIVNEPAEAIFQIQAIPNITQIGQYQPLLSETRIKAVDEFTGLQLENFDTALTTSLPDDVTVGQGGGRVVQ